MLQQNDLYGKCTCGAFNALTFNACTTCGKRLPWAGKTINVRHSGGAARSVQARSVQPKARPRNASTNYSSSYYWDNVFGSGLNDRSSVNQGVQPTAPPRFSAPNQPTRPLQPSAAATTTTPGIGSGTVAAYQFCPRCGTGLGRSTNFCPMCRKDTVSSMLQFDWPLARFSLSIGAIMVGGFLMGVVWCSFLMNYLGQSNTAQRPTAQPTTIIQQQNPSEYSLKMTAQALPR